MSHRRSNNALHHHSKQYENHRRTAQSPDRHHSRHHHRSKHASSSYHSQKYRNTDRRPYQRRERFRSTQQRDDYSHTSQKTARKRDREKDYQHRSRSRSRSRDREIHDTKMTKSKKTITTHPLKVFNFSNRNQFLYGKLFSKKYQSIIVNIMDRLDTITFADIYQNFKKTDEYNQILKEFNGIEKNVQRSMKRLLTHFMDKKMRVLEQDQHHKLNQNLPLQTGRKWARFKKKMILKFDDGTVKSKEEEDKKDQDDIKMKQEKMDDNEDDLMQTVDNKDKVNISDVCSFEQGIEIKTKRNNDLPALEMDDIDDDDDEVIITDEIIIKKEIIKIKQESSENKEEKDKEEDEKKEEKEEEEVHITGQSRNDVSLDVFNLTQSNMTVRFCPKCHTPAYRNDYDIRVSCSVMTCRAPQCGNGEDYLYWCWDCGNIMPNAILNPVTGEVGGQCRRCRKRHRCKPKPNYRM